MMNSREGYFPRLDPVPGEGMLARKRFQNLQMEATVFQQATNLQPPLDPPQPPMDPVQAPAEIIIEQWLKCNSYAGSVHKSPVFVKLAPRAKAQSNVPKETQVC